MTGKEVLRAIADGALPEEFEWQDDLADKQWCPFISSYWDIYELAKTQAQFRRKLPTRIVNGFTVPAPIQEMPAANSYYLAMPDVLAWFKSYEWYGYEFDKRFLSRGLLFSTKEAAIANAKAMCGIDPSTN